MRVLMKFTTFISYSALLGAGSLYVGSTYYYYSPFYPRVRHANAVIYPTKGSTVSGLVTFNQETDGLHINATFSGLKPGNHGFHIHEFGDCACDDAICAGNHFNPTNHPHGSPVIPNRHVGDLGNVTADEQGNATYSYVDRLTTLNGPHSIIGRSVIIHTDADDFTTQPTGNSGARIGCGVIGIVK